MSFVIEDGLYRAAKQIINQLIRELSAQLVALVDHHGLLIAISGNYREVDTTTLAARWANTVGEKDTRDGWYKNEAEGHLLYPINEFVVLGVGYDLTDASDLTGPAVMDACQKLKEIFAQVEWDDDHGFGTLPSGTPSSGPVVRDAVVAEWDC